MCDLFSIGKYLLSNNKIVYSYIMRRCFAICSIECAVDTVLVDGGSCNGHR